MGLTPKFKLYTVPGQTYYQASRRLILQGVDGVVFVADSDPKRLRANIESWQHLNQHLRSYRVDMRRFPVIVQANKRDLSNPVSLPLLVKALNARGYPLVESVATRGTGVTDALKLVIQAVLRTVTKR
jgi:signal recognition particle receptor subunit beta